MRRILALGLLVAALWLSASHGQPTPASERSPPIEGFIFGGFSRTAGEAASYLQDGWIIDGGFIYWLAHGDTFGLRTDLGYSEHEASDQFLGFGTLASGQRLNDGSGSFSSLSSGLVLRAPGSSWPRLYGLAQLGLTHTHVRLAQTFYLPGYYCDPFFYYCSSPAFGQASVYSHTSDRFSWNLGLGLDFGTHSIPGWFLELQYRRVENSPHAFEYWPVMVGLRF